MSAQASFVPSSWERAGLESAGFAGFVPMRHVAEAAIPSSPGVYIVLRTTDAEPQFLAEPVQQNPKKDPHYSTEELAGRWVAGAQVVNIGKGDDLRRRLRQYARYGLGAGTNHNGGRSIWQLADHEDLLVAWQPIAFTNDVTSARDAEKMLIAAFQRDHDGRRPFANVSA